MTILITGGTGKTGRRLAEALNTLGIPYRVAARHPNDAEKGCKFDWQNRETWDEALHGVSGLYVVPRPGGPGTEMIDFIRTARSKGASRVVVLSASLLPAGGPGAGEVHQWLQGGDQDWAVIRPSWFMENFSEGPHRQTIIDENAIYSAAGDGKVGFVSADDIAAVAAAVFLADHAPNSDLVLTGPAAISHDDAAAVLSRQLGRNIRHLRLSAEALAQRHIAHGVPAPLAHILAAMDDMIARGAEDRTTAVVEAQTGRRPVDFTTFCSAHSTVWRAK
jgi:ergot alkaloid biosynthesis protein